MVRYASLGYRSVTSTSLDIVQTYRSISEQPPADNGNLCTSAGIGKRSYSPLTTVVLS
jgi:hypothetical protein